jgi:hypothetical protein
MGILTQQEKNNLLDMLTRSYSQMDFALGLVDGMMETFDRKDVFNIVEEAYQYWLKIMLPLAPHVNPGNFYDKQKYYAKINNFRDDLKDRLWRKALGL